MFFISPFCCFFVFTTSLSPLSSNPHLRLCPLLFFLSFLSVYSFYHPCSQLHLFPHFLSLSPPFIAPNTTTSFLPSSTSTPASPAHLTQVTLTPETSPAPRNLPEGSPLPCSSLELNLPGERRKIVLNLGIAWRRKLKDAFPL